MACGAILRPCRLGSACDGGSIQIRWTKKLDGFSVVSLHLQRRDNSRGNSRRESGSYGEKPSPKEESLEEVLLLPFGF